MAALDLTFPFSVLLIAGPTASGKSALALRAAQNNHGIIINADALQIYNALPLLTAQPSQADRGVAPHVLYGTQPPDAEINVKSWMDMVTQEIQRAWRENALPIVVGGTGLYLKSLIHGLSPLPDVPADVRAATRARQAELGNPAFHAELVACDPVMAARLNPNDTQRLIRAMEVIRATGKSLHDWQQIPGTPPLPQARFHSLLVDLPRAELRARSHKRLENMVDQGVLDEVLAFADQIEGGALSAACGPTKALGYHAFVRAARGEIDIDRAIDLAQLETGQYIKRQQTWLRHQMTFDEIVRPDSA